MDISIWSFIRCEEHRQVAWTVDHLVKKCSSVFSVQHSKWCDVTFEIYVYLLVSATHPVPKPQRRVGSRKQLESHLEGSFELGSLSLFADGGLLFSQIRTIIPIRTRPGKLSI